MDDDDINWALEATRGADVVLLHVLLGTHLVLLQLIIYPTSEVSGTQNTGFRALETQNIQSANFSLGFWFQVLEKPNFGVADPSLSSTLPICKHAIIWIYVKQELISF